MYDLVLFDLDGTLVDTAPDIADAVNRVLADRGQRSRSAVWVRDRIGQGSRALLVEAYGSTPDTATVAALMDEFADAYARTCGKRGRLFPEAATVLTTLRNAGVRLALLTNKEERYVRFLLEVHGLDSDFDAQVCGDTLVVKKPDPEVVHNCLRALGVPKHRALLVGDSSIDVATARAAGVEVWAVNYGYNHGKPIADSRPDRIIASLSEVLEPFAERITAVAGPQPPRASSSSLYLRSNPRN